MSEKDPRQEATKRECIERTARELAAGWYARFSIAGTKKKKKANDAKQTEPDPPAGR